MRRAPILIAATAVAAFLLLRRRDRRRIRRLRWQRGMAWAALDEAVSTAYSLNHGAIGIHEAVKRMSDTRRRGLGREIPTSRAWRIMPKFKSDLQVG